MQVLCDLEVVVRLKVEPEPGRRPEVSTQPHRRVGRDGPLAEDDLVDAPGWDTDVLRKAVLAQPVRMQEILEQDLPGVDRQKAFGGPWPGGQSASYRTPENDSTNNTYGYSNAAFDELVSGCDSIVGDDERAACYNEADAYVTTRTKDPNGLFMLPLTQKPSFYTFSNRRLEAGAIAPDANNAGPLVYVVDFKPRG